MTIKRISEDSASWVQIGSFVIFFAVVPKALMPASPYINYLSHYLNSGLIKGVNSVGEIDI